MAVTYAKVSDIQAMISSIVNANPVGAFSDRVATDNTSDMRYSDDFIRVARRMSAARIIEAIALNPAHAYWGTLKENVNVNHGDVIPPCFGNMGTPEIKPVNHASWSYLEGKPASADEIQSYRGEMQGAATFQLFSNPLGETSYNHQQATTSGVKNPLSCRYNTDNGIITFTGYACRIPMIKVPDDGGRALTPTVTVSSGSPNVKGSLVNSFTNADIGKRIIVVYDNQVIFTGIILSLTTTTLTDDTAVTNTNATLDQAGAEARTEDVDLAVNDILDHKIMLPLAATNVRLAIGLLVKEGDSLRQIVGLYAGAGEVDLIKITQGATSVDALDVTRAIQDFQRYR